MKKENLNIVIVDYQLSNLFSVENACRYIGLEAKISSIKKEIERADALIFPGVGAFHDAMVKLNKLDLVSPILDFINSGKPFFGICLGLQLLLTDSEEFSNTPGLGVINGHVCKLPNHNDKKEKIKVPHMGWNQIYSNKINRGNWDNSPLAENMENEFMYFVHSYYVALENTSDNFILTKYNDFEFCAGVLKNNIFAVQFHPEKSGSKGLQIYAMWANYILENHYKNK